MMAQIDSMNDDSELGPTDTHYWLEYAGGRGSEEEITMATVDEDSKLGHLQDLREWANGHHWEQKGRRRRSRGLGEDDKMAKLAMATKNEEMRKGPWTEQEDLQLVRAPMSQVLTGRTDNEIKNYWRTRMRKKAQERRMSTSRSPSPSSSSSNISSSANKPPPEELVMKKRDGTESVAVGGSLTVGFGTNEGVMGYSMDQIWDEIGASDRVSGFSTEEHKDGARSVASPVWERCSASQWKVGDEEFEMPTPTDGLVISNL
ncbi:hypothetical protein BHE74_00053351 [Ensete ventricosum]|nr:hypothetical protein BHE74_00053351 [Ensete ventricosum]RZS22139.1 hypothetical protein BHM03_00054879 [Ensete ventricosum]